MRNNLKITEAIFPMPVLLVATYNEDGSTNAMTAAWGTMVDRDIISLQLEETHKTVENIKARGAFTVNIADAAHTAEADYLGIVSGHKAPDKFEHTGLSVSRSETVDAPIINELPLALECEFIEFQSDEFGGGVIGRVKSVTADERVMVNGRVDISLVDAIAYDPYTHGYYRVSERVGNAFRDGLKFKNK